MISALMLELVRALCVLALVFLNFGHACDGGAESSAMC